MFDGLFRKIKIGYLRRRLNEEECCVEHFIEKSKESLMPGKTHSERCYLAASSHVAIQAHEANILRIEKQIEELESDRV